jgi:hypothetical protein
MFNKNKRLTKDDSKEIFNNDWTLKAKKKNIKKSKIQPAITRQDLYVDLM